MIQEQVARWTRTLCIALVVGVGVIVSQVQSVAASTNSSFLPTDQNVSFLVHQPIRIDLSTQVQGSGYRWSIVGGMLPDGVFFDAATGLFWGTPTRTGEFRFSVEMRDPMDTVFTNTVTMRVYSAEEAADAAVEVFESHPQKTQVPVSVEPVQINLDRITDEELEFLLDTFADDAPLLYVGPNAPTSILKINIAQMRIKPNGLYRIEGGTVSTVNEGHAYSDVYYVSPNGRRHAFSTEGVFMSWYDKDTVIESVPDWKLANIPLRENVTFRPGTTVRLEGTQEVYYVSTDRLLKKFDNEATYRSLELSVSEPLPVLPVAHIADYQIDEETIKVRADMPVQNPLPRVPAETMSQM